MADCTECGWSLFEETVCPACGATQSPVVMVKRYFCPSCGTEMNQTSEERWTGKFKNILSVYEYLDCPKCGYHSYLLDEDHR